MNPSRRVRREVLSLSHKFVTRCLLEQPIALTQPPIAPGTLCLVTIIQSLRAVSRVSVVSSLHRPGNPIERRTLSAPSDAVINPERTACSTRIEAAWVSLPCSSRSTYSFTRSRAPSFSANRLLILPTTRLLRFCFIESERYSVRN
jgi:hypothetical protein